MLGVEPQVRYAKSSDGVSVAWFSIGSGQPLVFPIGPVDAGLVDSWHIPEYRGVLEWIAQRARLVVFDSRGFGLSDRDVTDFSCDAFVRDIEAVVDAADLEAVTLQSFTVMSVPALVFAARHPAQVNALILVNGVMRGADLSDQWGRWKRLAAEDWEYAKGVLSRGGGLYSSTASLEGSDQRMTQAVTQDRFLAFSEALLHWDASAVAGGVEAPALVTHTGPSVYTSLDAARQLATRLPKGTFAPIHEPDPAARLAALGRVISAFLRDSVPRSTREEPPNPRASGTVVILFTDIVDSTALTERHGDEAFRTSSRALDDAIRKAMRDEGGRPVTGKVLGDGVMGVFQSAAKAIDCAHSCVTASAAADLELHVGLHAGDVIHEDSTVYGGAVNIASRICGLSQPGEILVSSTVRDLARTSSTVEFDDRGKRSLKGIADAVQLCAVSRDPRH